MIEVFRWGHRNVMGSSEGKGKMKFCLTEAEFTNIIGDGSGSKRCVYVGR